MISSIRVRNFKAVEDSGPVRLTPLTVFVGHNGSGKSSLIEGLELLQQYALHGLDTALAAWYDFDHILWQGTTRKRTGKSPFFDQPMAIDVTGRASDTQGKRLSWRMEWQLGHLAEPTRQQPAKSVAVKSEVFRLGNRFLLRRDFGKPVKDYTAAGAGSPKKFTLPDSEPLFTLDASHGAADWLFLNLNPGAIGQPFRRPARRTLSPLEKSGSNLADVLESFLLIDPKGFNAMLDALRYILPYASDVKPQIIRDMVESRSLILLTESFEHDHHANLPGWVLSGGTLRLLALLAALRHPKGPEVLIVEELENGLDPRAIGFVVEEIRDAVENGGKQVIATTHSPYLLDKLALEHIVTVERPQGGPPVFQRPAEIEELKKWSEKFAPGSLYTMGRLRSPISQKP